MRNTRGCSEIITSPRYLEKKKKNHVGKNSQIIPYFFLSALITLSRFQQITSLAKFCQLEVFRHSWMLEQAAGFNQGTFYPLTRVLPTLLLIPDAKITRVQNTALFVQLHSCLTLPTLMILSSSQISDGAFGAPRYQMTSDNSVPSI